MPSRATVQRFIGGVMQNRHGDEIVRARFFVRERFFYDPARQWL